MKIRLFVAANDADYLDHLSDVLTEKHAETFETSVCSDQSRAEEIIRSKRVDIALVDAATAKSVSLNGVPLALLLTDGSDLSDDVPEIDRIRKYQRISSMVSEILEKYAVVARGRDLTEGKRTRVTVLWSPCGGTGKTSVALACAAKRAGMGQTAVYLDLEAFSSTEAFFGDGGKSISTVFEKLDSNLELLLKSIRQQDKDSGIWFFQRPLNYDDINILTTDDLERLIRACAGDADSLIVDLGSAYDVKVRKLFEMADEVMIVLDPSPICAAKWNQFVTQHDVYKINREKLFLVGNKGAKPDKGASERTLSLPLVNSAKPVEVYKTLSAYWHM